MPARILEKREGSCRQSCFGLELCFGVFVVVLFGCSIVVGSFGVLCRLGSFRLVGMGIRSCFGMVVGLL